MQASAFLTFHNHQFLLPLLQLKFQACSYPVVCPHPHFFEPTKS